MKNIFIFLLSVVLLTSCGNKTEETNSSQETIETTVDLTEAQHKSAGIELGKLEKKKFPVF